MRLSLRIAILLLVGVLVAQTWLVLGLVTPVVVAGGSMAPALVGEHYQIACPDCSRQFNCGAESLPPDQRVFCPSCGAFSQVSPATVKPADRLFVDRTAFLRSQPQRWGIVVCPLPESAGELCVKRVVGLPGECISLVDGDVYADGKILRKDWPTLSSLAIPVDSSRFQPASGAAVSIWRPDGDASGWHSTDGGFELAADGHSPTGNDDAGVDWLTYHHEQIIRQGDNVVRREGPILDDLDYNQDESRESAPVADLILSCRLRSKGEGEIWLRARDGRKEFAIRLELAGRRGEVREADGVVARFVLPTSVDFQRSPLVTLALADCRLQMLVGEATIVDNSYEPSDSPSRQPTGVPFSIGAVGGPLKVIEWSISRDIYYLPPPGRSELPPRTLGPAEYWLLGDNSALSLDGRTWLVPITRDSLVGKILRWR